METPYSATFVPKLKRAAQGMGRWNAEKKIWLVPDSTIAVVLNCIKDEFGDYDYTPKTPTVSVATGGGAFEDFVKALGYEAAHLAYRKRAAQLHTDAGGSHEDMARLNASWQAIREALK